MSLFNHELIHLLLTSLAAVFIWIRFGKRKPCVPNALKTITNYQLLIILVFFVGIFLDIDHLYDYLRWSGGRFVLSEFLKPSLYVHLSQKVYVPLHGFEIGLFLWFISRKIEKRLNLLGLSLSLSLAYFAHLLWDNISFQHHPLAYSIIYRIINQFSVQCFDGF